MAGKDANHQAKSPIACSDFNGAEARGRTIGRELADAAV